MLLGTILKIYQLASIPPQDLSFVKNRVSIAKDLCA
jgi:hypothetical protein